MRIIKRIFSALALIAVCGMLAGCQKFELNGRGSRKIGIKVSSSDTKGSVNTTTSLNASGQSFGLIAVNDLSYVDNGTTYSAGFYFESVVKYVSGNWDTYDPSTGNRKDYMWINDNSMHFWSYYPLDGEVDSAAEGLREITAPSAGSDALTFTYSLPTPSSSFIDATNQKDLIFAGNEETRTFDDDGDITDTSSSNTLYSPTTDKNDVDIRFYHALSEIRFAVSPDDGSFDTALKIKAIKISNVAGTADCEFTLPSTFDWDNHSSYCDYCQTTGASGVTFSSKPTGWTSSTFNTDKTLYTMDERFFMIPQTLDSFAEITVTFQYLDSDGNYQSVDRSFSIGGEEWKAGYYYTYKIAASSVGHDIMLSIFLVEWEDENLAILV